MKIDLCPGCSRMVDYEDHDVLLCLEQGDDDFEDDYFDDLEDDDDDFEDDYFDDFEIYE